MADPARQADVLIIACGALGRELTVVLKASRFAAVDVTCLPAILHNRPEQIPGAVAAKIAAYRARYKQILCLYGDCGTGGELDRVLGEAGVPRIDGAHCYAFLAGPPVFADWAEEEIGTFYLTDYLARHFDRLVIAGLGLDRHPELMPMYFSHYTRVLYLAQSEDPSLEAAALRAATRLGLPLTVRQTGLGALATFVGRHVAEAA